MTNVIAKWSGPAAACLLIGCVVSGLHGRQTELVGGEHIPVGTSGGIGPLAGTAIWHNPLGYAHVYGSAQPDLFIMQGRWYPGVYLYRWEGTSENGAPIFGERVRVALPSGIRDDHRTPGEVFEGEDGMVHGVWVAGGALVHSVYETDRSRFVETGRVELPELPRGPHALTVLKNPDGGFEVVLGLHDGTGSRPAGWRDTNWRPYDDKGAFTGSFGNGFLYAVTLADGFSGPAAGPRRVSATGKEVWITYRNLAAVDFGSGARRDVVGGSLFGNLSYYKNTAASGVSLAPRGYAVGSDENRLRHPTIAPGPAAYPNPDTGLSDLIAAGEGAFYHYRFTGEFTGRGEPVFADPVPVLRKNAHLYGGSLPVINVVDWNGNGVLDIVAGYSDGRVLFHENLGSNAEPAFAPGTPVFGGGEPIHIQPGYTRSLQGPWEARWGYVCPRVVDWNGNGLPDILLGSSTSEYKIYLNRGTPAEPKLDYGRPLYVKGLDLFGTWRVQPAAAKMGDRMALVVLDEDNELRLYWRRDDFNLEDAGKLRMGDGTTIRGNFLDAGGSGRAKLNLVDWDGDGVMDLLIGTPRHGSFPNPETGLPQSLGLPGAAVLLMRNSGTNEEPVFEFPQVLRVGGQKRFFGQHACSPAVADFGEGPGHDLIVARENGEMIFFHRADVSFHGAIE